MLICVIWPDMAYVKNLMKFKPQLTEHEYRQDEKQMNVGILTMGGMAAALCLSVLRSNGF